MAELDKRNSTPPHTHPHEHTHAHHTTPISAIIVIHLSVFLPLPPLSPAFITGVHGALLLYDSLATIVRVYTCVCEQTRESALPCPCSQCMRWSHSERSILQAMSTVGATNLQPWQNYGAQKECVWPPLKWTHYCTALLWQAPTPNSPLHPISSSSSSQWEEKTVVRFL